MHQIFEMQGSLQQSDRTDACVGAVKRRSRQPIAKKLMLQTQVQAMLTSNGACRLGLPTSRQLQV